MLWRNGLAMTHASPRMRHGLFPLALLLCWLVTVGSGQDQDCDILEVSVVGSSQWPFEGTYTYLGPGVDGTSVFKHTCHGMHIFYSNILQNPRWFLGADPNRFTGYAYIDDSATYPAEISGLWYEWAGTGGGFDDQKNITISCQADTACPRVMVWGPEVPKYLMGVYNKTGSLQNRRPVYKHKTDSVYLYHQQSGPSCQRWVFGPEVGQSLVSMYTSSATYFPPTQATAWTLIEPHQHRQLSQVYLSCVDESGTTPDPIDPITEEPECGQRKINGGQFPAALLYNGEEIDYPGKWPFTVSIFKQDGQHKCAGTLIGRRWVLTASHCATDFHPWRSYLIVMGTSNLDAVEPGRQVQRIKNVFRHEGFSWTGAPFKLLEDILLLELEEEVTYTDFLQPACLPRQGETLPLRGLALDSPFSDCWMMGWGLTTEEDTSGGILQEAPVELGDVQTCAQREFTPDLAWAAETKAFCAYNTNSAKICKGDSGGPILCKRNDGAWTLVGIASWTIVECYNLGVPSVYTDVTQYLDWINQRLPSQ